MATKLKINDLMEVKSLDSKALNSVRGGVASEPTLFSHPMQGSSMGPSPVLNQYFDVDQTFIGTLNLIDSLTLYDQDVTQNLVNIVDVTAVDSLVSVVNNQAQTGNNSMV